MAFIITGIFCLTGWLSVLTPTPVVIAARVLRAQERAGVATTVPAATSPARAPATAAARAGPEETLRAYLDALEARDRDRMREMVFLPSDPQRRQWVLNVINHALFLPP